MKISQCLPFLFILGLACRNQEKNESITVPGKAEASDSATTFLPVADLLKEDMRNVDSFASGILLRREIDGKKDSAFIKPAEFHRLSQVFLLPDLDSAAFQQHFSEVSMMDETTQFLQFIYSATSPEPQVRKVMVYVSPGTSSHNVKRIYMERSYSSGDTSINQKMTWKMGGYFLVVTLKEPRDGESRTSIEKVIWDPLDFNED